MQCPLCNKELREGAAFCPACGTPLATPQATPSATPAATVAPGADARKNTIFIVAGIALAAVLAVAGIVGFKLFSDYQQAHGVRTVEVKLDKLGYNAKTDSPVALRVQGTDLDGASVNFDAFTCAEGFNPVSLQQGEYDIQVLGSPILADGTIFDISNARAHVSVTETSGNTVAVEPPMTAIPAQDVTDEQIEAAKQVVQQSGISQEKVDSYVGAITNKRTAERERIAAENAARAEAERQAAKHVELSGFAFDLPDYWLGRVSVSNNGSEATITDNNTGKALATAKVESTSDPLYGGDLSGGVLLSKEIGSKRLTFYGSCWPFYAWAEATGKMSKKTAGLAGLVDLQTGGTCSFDQAKREENSGKYATSFLRSTIEPTIRAI